MWHPITKKAGNIGQCIGSSVKIFRHWQQNVFLQSFVLCYYNYCRVVWPFIGTEVLKIERVQYRALKFMYITILKPPMEWRGRDRGCHFCTHIVLGCYLSKCKNVHLYRPAVSAQYNNRAGCNVNQE